MYVTDKTIMSLPLLIKGFVPKSVICPNEVHWRGFFTSLRFADITASKLAYRQVKFFWCLSFKLCTILKLAFLQNSSVEHLKTEIISFFSLHETDFLNSGLREFDQDLSFLKYFTCCCFYLSIFHPPAQPQTSVNVRLFSARTAPHLK